MSRNLGRRTLFLLAALLAGATARADLVGAQQAYAAKDFAGAFQQFLETATLGNLTAQENLAAMYVDGEGVARDNVLGYAWAVIARENGGSAAMQNIIDQLQPHLDDKSRARVKAVTDQFGKAALAERLLPAPAQPESSNAVCRMTRPANPDDYFPRAAASQGVSGTVFIEAAISPDGRVHRPHVWFSIPEGVFDGAGRAVTWNSGFAGRKTDSGEALCGIRFKTKFTSQGDSSIAAAYQKARGPAEAGDPLVQVLYGLLMFHEGSGNAGGVPLDWFVKSAQAGVPYAQYLVGVFLLKLDPQASEAENRKGLAWLQLAAANGRPEAKFALANYRLRTDPAATSDATVFAWLEDAAKAGHRDGTMYLAALLATSPDASRRDPARATSLIDPGKWDFSADPTAFEILAAANAHLGKFADARSLQERAIRVAAGYRWNVDALEERLAKYQAGAVWTGNLLDP